VFRFERLSISATVRCPEDFHPIQGDSPDTVLINGGSMIVFSAGASVGRTGARREGISVAELDLGDIARGKYDLDVVGALRSTGHIHLVCG